MLGVQNTFENICGVLELSGSVFSSNSLLNASSSSPIFHF